jgi:hypothetical protein
MDQPVIEYRGQKQKPSNLLWNSYPRVGIDLPVDDELLTVDLPGATLTLDCEDQISISAFNIRRRTVNFRQSRPGKPLFDHSLRERKALRLVVTDEEGRELDAKALSELPLGFDTELEEGELYELPSLGFFYWLKRIDGDQLYWIMIESFQHGKFIQAEIVQNGRPKGYVKVEDAATRLRLQRRLVQHMAARKPMSASSL